MRHGIRALLATFAIGAFVAPLVLRSFVLPDWRPDWSLPQRTPPAAMNASDPTPTMPIVDERLSIDRAMQRATSGPGQVSTEPATAFMPEPNSTNSATNSAALAKSPVVQAHWLDTVPPARGEAPAAASTVATDLRGLIYKIMLGSTAVVVLCATCLYFTGSSQQRVGGDRQMHVTESIRVSREAAVKLIQVGEDRVVVVQDRGGVRGMVLLPRQFDSLLSDAGVPRRKKGSESETLSDGSLLSSVLRNPEDNGWDLSQQIS